MNKYQQHLISNSLKGKVYFHLINFSSENKPLGSGYFYDHIADPSIETKRDFQRKLAAVVSEIFEDQKIYKEFVVCSCNEGYFIPKTEQGFLKGKGYLISKIDEVQEKIRFIDEMRLLNIYGTETAIDFFS